MKETVEKDISEIERDAFIHKLVKTAEQFRMPELTEKTEPGLWYRVSVPGYVCGNGEPYHGNIRIGTENHVLIVFCGGGASWNHYTAARPISIHNTGDEAFYFDDVEPLSDMIARGGINSQEEWNPFRDWSVIVVNYSSGDFHIGNAEFHYKSLDGEDRILYHNGFQNYRIVLETAKKYVGNPDKLLIAGMSAGGFGASALADDVIQAFPECKDITCCIDSALFRYDWKQIISETWNAPKEISCRIQSDNVTLDWLSALYQKYGENMKYLYMNSIRDGELAKYQQFLDGDTMTYTKEGGEKFRKNLEKMCKNLQQVIPDIGIYIYSHPYPRLDPSLELTQHTLLLENTIRESEGEQKSVLDWLHSAVFGNVERIGLELLDN